MTYIFNNQVITTPNFDSSGFDAFGRMRMSHPETIFSDRGLFNNEIYWSSAVSGAGSSVDTTNSANSSEISLIVGGNAGDYVYRQSRQRAVYQLGKSHLFMSTGVLEPKANVRQRIGFFDTKNGIFFEHDGTQMNIVVRTNTTGSVSESRYPQSTWNVDTMDGTGNSGITLDYTKAQIFLVDMEWLGVGRIRCGFVVDGKMYYVHFINNANVISSTYMGHAALPVRYEIENTGTTNETTQLKSICSTVLSEGGQQVEGLAFQEDTGTDPITVPTDQSIPLISLRINPDYLNSNISLVSTQILNTTNSYINYKVIYNANLTGASWTNSEDFAQIDTSATAWSGGKSVDGGYAANRAASTLNELRSRLSLGFDINDVPDTLTLVAQSISGNASVYASVVWRETY